MLICCCFCTQRKWELRLEYPNESFTSRLATSRTGLPFRMFHWLARSSAVKWCGCAYFRSVASNHRVETEKDPSRFFVVSQHAVSPWETTWNSTVRSRLQDYMTEAEYRNIINECALLFACFRCKTTSVFWLVFQSTPLRIVCLANAPLAWLPS